MGPLQAVPFAVRLATGTSPVFLLILLHQPGEEMLYVLQGEVEVRLGQNTYLLKPNDCITYDGPQLTSFSSVGSEDLIMLCAMTPPVF